MSVHAHRRYELLARALVAACSLAGAPNMELGTAFGNEEQKGAGLLVETAPDLQSLEQ
jgi:hypothetical protein